MAYEQKEGQGSLFKNDKREHEKHPNLKGSITIGGAKFWLSAWTKERDNGEKWFSIQAKPADESKPKPAPKRTLESHEPGSIDDDIPW